MSCRALLGCHMEINFGLTLAGDKGSFKVMAQGGASGQEAQKVATSCTCFTDV